jgi:hypothetical protein
LVIYSPSENFLSLLEFEPWAVVPLASRHTDYAISASQEIFTKDKLIFFWGGGAGAGAGMGLSAQFMMKRKGEKLKLNEVKEMVCITFVKQFVQCVCIASNGRGTGFEQLLGNHLDIHPDFVQTVVALHPAVACMWALLKTCCLTADFVNVTTEHQFAPHVERSPSPLERAVS